MDSSLFNQLVDEANLGIALFDSERKCSYLNNIGREMLGINSLPNQELGFNFESLCGVEPEDGIAAGSYRPVSSEMFGSLEGVVSDVVVKTLIDTEFVSTVYFRKVKSSADSAVYTVFMFQDTTSQKKMQRDLTVKQRELQGAFESIVKQNEELKQYDKSKDKFMALATHELRTPLAAVLATAEVLKEGLCQNEQEVKELISSIYDETNHLLEIVNDILDLSKIQAGKMVFNISQSNVAALVEKEISRFKPMADAKNVKLILEIKNNDCSAYFDSLRLSQAIGNVLSNAIKFTKKDTDVGVRIESKNGLIEVAISDQGPGIPKGKELSVFSEFETLGNINSHHKGTGLGMPISRRLMEIMGGNISLFSEEGKGATFIVSIPSEKVLPEECYRNKTLRAA